MLTLDGGELTGGLTELIVSDLIVDAEGVEDRTELLPNMTEAIAAICALTAVGLVGTLTLLVVSRGTARSRTRPCVCSLRPLRHGASQVHTSQLTRLGVRMPGINTVVGAGILGTQIAYHSALYGFRGVVHDLTEDALLVARARMDELGDHYREAGVAADQVDAALGRVQFTTDLVLALADADLVIEADSGVFQVTLGPSSTQFENVPVVCPEPHP